MGGLTIGQPYSLPDSITEGGRNNELTRYAGQLRGKGYESQEIERELSKANEERCKPPLPESEIRSIAKSACSWHAGHSAEFQSMVKERGEEAGHKASQMPEITNGIFNDKTLSRVFAREYRNRLRYVTQARSWYAFDGVRWVDGEGGGEQRAQRLMKRFSDKLCDAAASVEDMRLRGEAMKAAGRYCQQNARARLLEDCKSELATSIDAFDCNRMLFNCKNATVDLRTMEPRPHDPADMITKVAGCDYNPDARYAKWPEFLRETFNGDDELAAYLQRTVGKALAADTTDERFTIAYGPTRTGKSTTLDTLLAMFGDYGATAQAETFQEVKRNSRTASGDVARLAGVRFLVCPEPPKGMMLDAALMKQLTGGDQITARKLNQSEFQFRPTFQLIMNTNYLPDVRDQTLFESGRVVVVPFFKRRAEGERDTGLKERMRDQGYLSGVLNWALAGLQKQRVTEGRIPKACRLATAKYATDSDRMGEFISAECETGENLRADGARLYERYTEWSNGEGYAKLSKRKFFQELERREGLENIGKSTVDHRTSRNVFTGIRLKDGTRAS